jgi:hypothetical protein
VPEKGAMLNTIAAFDARSVRFGRELPPKPDSNLIFREKICWKSSGFMGPQLAGPFLSLFQMASGRIAYVAACETCQLLRSSLLQVQTNIHTYKSETRSPSDSSAPPPERLQSLLSITLAPSPWAVSQPPSSHLRLLFFNINLQA